MDTLGDNIDVQFSADVSDSKKLTAGALKKHSKASEPTPTEEDDEEMDVDRDDSRSTVSKASTMKRAKAAAKRKKPNRK